MLFDDNSLVLCVAPGSPQVEHSDTIGTAFLNLISIDFPGLSFFPRGSLISHVLAVSPETDFWHRGWSSGVRLQKCEHFDRVEKQRAPILGSLAQQNMF